MSEKIRDFIKRWKNKGGERQDTQKFWIELLTDVLGVEDATKRIDFEKTVKIKGEDGVGRTKFIDAYLPETKVLIEQKDEKLSLQRKYKMSGTNTKYTPYEQGDRYGRHMNHDEHPRYIVACNFREFEVHDNNKRGEAPQVIKLEDLERDHTRLSFLVSAKNEHLEREKELSVQAGRLVGKIYDSLLEMYKDPENEESLKSLNVLIVRLVFILYAEDAGIFKKQQFLNYMEQYRDNPGTFRRELLTLFDVLDTPADKRDPYLEEGLSDFPYVNGGLFNKKMKIEIPLFSEEAIDLILNEAAAGFDWRGISPTIFGATFEATLNPETRRSGGMHYTSLENIHKVIDPLFLDGLKEELERIEIIKNEGSRVNALRKYIGRLSNLKFLDPACGSGNFLTETYLELRRLENKALSIINKGQAQFADINLYDPIKVRLDQLYGIEINDFAVAVANTALFISEYQMLKQTEAVVNMRIDYLPLHSFEGIREGNALRMDWNDVLPAKECSYVMGNPPFLGYSQQSPNQKKDLKSVLVDERGKIYPRSGKLDFVSGWFYKAASYIQDTNIEVAFVATNSITQGDQVEPIWRNLAERFHIVINFAYTTFIWNNESKDKAHVHVVIIGFSTESNERNNKVIYSINSSKRADNINHYLLNAPNILISSRRKPISEEAPEIVGGNRPADGGNLIIEANDLEDFIKKDPKSKKFIKRLVGSVEFLHNKPRYCLWLVDASPKEIRQMPEVFKRVQLCREDRLKGAQDRVKLAETPHLFRETFNPSKALLIPNVTSEKRRYIPIDYIDSETISTNRNFLISDCPLYVFGILTSNVHNAWMRAVAGRLKSDYSYSKGIVYNNFPWPSLNDKQKQLIEKTAQNILDVRSRYPENSLADLYDELLMPLDLRKAHQMNDRAVMEAYGWNWRNMSEEDCVEELMKLYQEMTSK